jgi:ABC-type Fe3+ transport system permease subunit
MTTPNAYPTQQKASSQAVTALVLGILGIVCCPLCAPVAWYMGGQELKAVQEGRSSIASQGMAKAGQILGIIGTIWMVVVALWIFFMGGMAVLQGLRNQ